MSSRRSLRTRLAVPALALVAASALATLAVSQTASVTVSIDASANRRAINPLVYGASWGTRAQLQELRTPLSRAGGNQTSRYNWQQNAENKANDWFYESLSSGDSTPGGLGDSVIADAKASGAQPMLTFPMIDWVAKLGPNRGKLASFSAAKYGAQQNCDWSWFPDACNGVRGDGSFVTGNDPNDANVPNSSTHQQNWAQQIVNRWGPASAGGLRYYILDNEHSIWHQTHRDVHPTGARMDEIRDRMVEYATKIKNVDGGALVVGPSEWGWSAFFYSGYDQQQGPQRGWSNLPDRAAHGNVDYMPWLLQQLRQASASSGRRLLDVFTMHYYPQGGEYGNDVSQTMQLRRNRSTRSLWDPNYVDESWVGDKVQLVPRLRALVNAHYPGTQIGVTEYSWGADDHINGATTQADIFGIFGREGLDLAARWTMPGSATPTYKAMKMYRNYDGAGRGFGETSVRAAVPNPDQLSAFAALRASDGALTVMVISKVLSGTTPVTLSLANFTPSGAAARWQLTSANAINRISDVSPSGTTLSFSVPAQSITMVVVPGGSAPNPNPTPTPTPTPGPTPTPTPTPGPTPPPAGVPTYGNGGQPWAISASATTRIQAENFDQGAEGVAYHDIDSGNNGGQYRTTGVDVEATTDAGAGYDVGWIAAGEWLQYTVNVAAAGSYELKLRTARAPAGDSLVRVLFAGADKTGDVPVPSTGGWQAWRDVVKTVSLSAGQQVMRIYMAGSEFNVNWIELRPLAAPPAGRQTYGNGGLPWRITASAATRIQAENFDQGGQGVAYFDADAGNNGGQYRTGERVDIEASSGGGYNVGWIAAGEWLEYTVEVATAGTYDITLRTARQPAGTSLVRVSFGAVNKTGDLVVPSTGAWQTWTSLTKTRVSLSAGRQVLRIQMVGGSFNVNWVEVRPSL